MRTAPLAALLLAPACVSARTSPTRVEFVEVNEGEQSQADNARLHATACPKIENADVN